MNAISGIPAAAAPAPAPALAEAREQGGFLRHIHLLRGLAILLVIGAHCWPAFAWSDEEQARVLLAFDNVTIVFMFISGLLFQHLSYRFNYARYLKHRFSIVVLPYLIVSIPAIAMVIFFVHRASVWPWVYQLPVWEQVLFFVATGKHLAPLWFIPMMTLFILAAPVFVWLDRRDAYAWALPISIVLAILLGRDSVSGMANVFGKALFMLPGYLAGMAFSHHRVAAEAWCERHVLLLLAGFGVSSWIMLAHPAHADFSLVQKLLLALLLIVAAKGLPIPGWLERGLGHIAKLSFALYFVHGYVITSFRTIYPHFGAVMPNSDKTGEIFAPSAIGLVFDIVLVSAATIAIVEVARRVLGKYSRNIIGA